MSLWLVLALCTCGGAFFLMLLRGNGESIKTFDQYTQPRRNNLWNIWRRRESGQSFYLGEDCSRSFACYEPVYGEPRRGECWMVLGKKGDGTRRILDRIVTGLIEQQERTFYITVAPTYSKESVKSLGGFKFLKKKLWYTWWHGVSNQVQPQWLDPNISYQRFRSILQVVSEATTNTIQANRLLSDQDFWAYAEAFWSPMITESLSFRHANNLVREILDVQKDSTLSKLRKYLDQNDLLTGDWQMRLERIQIKKSMNDSLGLLWQYLNEFSNLESQVPCIPLSKPNHWFMVFPDRFLGAVAHTLELLLALPNTKPGLIILDHLGDLLPTEVYFGQLERLKRAGWSVIIADPSLSWIERGDEGETQRLSSLIDNWVFGRLDGASAMLLEKQLNLYNETARTSVSKSRDGLFGGKTSTSVSFREEALIPASTMTRLEFSKAIVTWRYPPSFEPNRVRLLATDS